jgi:hypothetical protein
LSVNSHFEMNALLQNAKQAWARMQVVVKSVLGEKHTLQWMSLSDRQRLTVLLVWEQKYKVSLEWMVEILLEHYQSKRKRIKSGRHYRNPALPVRVVTLVSETSRELVENAIAEHYPNDEHLSAWRARQQGFLAGVTCGKAIQSMTEFDSLDDYVEAYSNSIMVHRSSMDKVTEQRRQTGRPYRNSPWR